MNSASAQGPDLAGLVRQRNRFGTAAVLLLVGSLGVCLPPFLKKHNELKRLNTEIVSLQDAIGSRQNATRAAQAAILETQNEITLAINAGRNGEK